MSEEKTDWERPKLEPKDAAYRLAADWHTDCKGVLPAPLTVAQGFVTDGASIPRFLWRVCGTPMDVPRIYAAVVHDWLYTAGNHTLPILTDDDGNTVWGPCTRADADRIYRDYDVKETPLPPRKFSKLKIYGAIISLPDSNGTSAWQKIQAWLEAKTIDGVNGWMAFQLAQELSEDHPLFAVLADEARQLLGLTKEQFDVILNQCILED